MRNEPVDSSYRFVPSSFDPRDALEALIWPRTRGWDACERIFRRHAVTGVMSRLPLFWQAEIPLQKAAVKTGAFIYLNDAKNMPVGAAALLSGDITAIVTDAADAASLAEYVSKQGMLAPVWILVHPGKISPLSPDLKHTDVHVYQEIHCVPGVAMFEQCDFLADAKQSVFHLSSGFEFHESGVRSTDPQAPLSASVSCSPAAICVCGKRQYIF